MNRRIHTLLLMLAMVLPLSAHTFKSESVLSSGKFVKIRVAQSGVCKLTYNELRDMSIDPSSVRVFGYGGALLQKDFRRQKIDDLPQVPVYKSSEQMGKDDYILFYAQGPISWQYNGGAFTHTQNQYSLYGYYFLSDNKGEELTARSEEASSFSSTASQNDSYYAFQVHDIDNINLVDINGEGEGGGKDFYYGTSFTGENVRQSFSFSFPGIIASESLRIRLKVAASASQVSQFVTSVGDRSYTTRVSAITLEKYERAVTETSSFSLPALSSDEQTIQLRYVPSSSTAKGFLDYIEVVAKCRMDLSNGSFVFTNAQTLGRSNNSLYSIANASASAQVWDITDLSAIRAVPVKHEGSTLRFETTNSSLRMFVAVEPASKTFVSATSQGVVNNQNLHAMKDIDLVVITNPKFVAQAEQLCQAHQEYDNLSWAVVTDEQVYNEYSSGTPDATAYRWVMKQLYDRSNNGEGRAPKYLLLFGDGSYDNRHINELSAPNTLLTYQADNSVNEVAAYSTDDYFGFLDDNEGVSDITARMDIAVGRMPANTLEEAQNLVDKTIRYMSNKSLGSWKTQLCFLADDGDHGLHTRVGDYAAENLRLTRPEYVVNKIYLDSYQQEVVASGEVYPLAKLKLHKLLNNGVLFFDYSGHGGYNNITSEAVLTANDIRQMHNESMGVWMLATCGFACYDARKTSSSEYAVLNPYGGAVAVISACRTVMASDNKIINRHFCDSLFALNHEDMSIGDALRKAKNLTGTNENKLAFILLGDPALRLLYPDRYKVETTILTDTLSALATARMEGRIVNEQSQTVDNFNGKMQVTVFDKMQELTTLDNDETDPSSKSQVKFNDYPNVIFKGEFEVKEGQFGFDFMVPVDIRYNFGQGRITMYAYDQEMGDEAMGYTHDVVVGGSSSAAFNDTIGPDMSIYLNTPNFVNGSEVGPSPVFFASLFDEQGINASGSGIGHDLLLIVDNEPDQTYVLNDYFRSVANSYKQGEVVYQLSELSEGRHELTFRAWDLLNNSRTKTLQFIVSPNAGLSLYQMRTYPNPVSQSGTVHIDIEHDHPQALITTTLTLQDPSGRLITTRQNVEVGRAQMNIDLAELSLTPGIYIYSVIVNADGEQTARKRGKLIVIE